MMIRAYDEEYLTGAQRILGDAFDFSVNTVGLNIDRFAAVFAVSDVSRQFEIGNPKYISGMTGCEIVREVLLQSGLKEPEQPDMMYTDKSPEYWSGWALAFYQWYTAGEFMSVFSSVKMSEVVQMYPVYHEMDILQFVDAMNEKSHKQHLERRLKRLRRYAGLSQRQLAEASDVPLRQIQLFEQGQRDINKTQAETLLKLSRTLNCRMEDLVEKV